MNKAMLTVGIIMLSAMAVLLINIVSDYTTGSELDYYLLKETTEAAMYDAIDEDYYEDNGLLRIDKEKFAENFLLRFAAGIDNSNKTYTIGFYDINETPPKVSVKVDTDTTLSFNQQQQHFSTTIDAILENDYQHDEYVKKVLRDPKSDEGYPITRSSGRKRN
ncbi:MAG: hypothetical protein IJF92_03980 [Bacilli bacterium]|nr:hypothetical protein [Bacilli bacterium]